MRILLTSNGFPAENKNAREELANLLRKDLKEVRVAFVPTASAVEKDRSFMKVDRAEVEEIGILPQNITDLELDHHTTVDELRNYDLIFVDGGNCFYLLEKVQQSGFDIAIKEYLTEDLGVYVGVSAGTVLAGPDIAFCDAWDDKSLGNPKGTAGLGLVSMAYSPHYIDGEVKILENLRRQHSYPIKEMPDGLAFVRDGESEKEIML